VPTTNISSIGTSSRDYSTIPSWEDDTDDNLVLADTVEVGACYNDSEFLITSSFSIVGATADATRHRILTAAAGESFIDHVNVATNDLNYDQSNGVGIRCNTGFVNLLLNQEDYCKVTRLQLKKEDVGSSRSVYETGNPGTNQSIQNCIVEQAGNGNAVYIPLSDLTTNCLFIVTKSGSTYAATRVAFNTTGMQNCTLVAPSDLADAPAMGLEANTSASSFVVKNCAVFGFDLAVTGTMDTTNSGYNGTDGASFIGSNNQTSLTYADQFQNTTLSGADFRLKSGADLIGAGTSDVDPAADEDIIGTPRSPYDIGCWQAPAAGPGYSPNQSMWHVFQSPITEWRVI